MLSNRLGDMPTFDSGLPRHCRVIFIIMFLLYPSSVQSDSGLKALEQAQGVVDLQLCREEKLGVELLCNRNWKQELDRDQAVMMIISQDPAVLLTVARSKVPVSGIEELTREKVRFLGHYAKGFKMAKVTINGSPAIMVEGFSEDFPETRLLDYYVVHDFQLYSFLFSVDPKEAWTDYSVLCAKIAESIKISGGQT